MKYLRGTNDNFFDSIETIVRKVKNASNQFFATLYKNQSVESYGVAFGSQ